MKKEYIILLVLFILVFITYISYTLFYNSTEIEINGSEYNLSICLTENNNILYGTDWCSYCKKQKDLFGESFKEINFIDCDKERDICIKEGIKHFPSWKINNKTYVGLKTLEELSKISGCNY